MTGFCHDLYSAGNVIIREIETGQVNNLAFSFFPSGAELNVYFFKELYIRQTRKENGTHIINTFSWESGGNGKKRKNIENETQVHFNEITIKKQKNVDEDQ